VSTPTRRERRRLRQLEAAAASARRAFEELLPAAAAAPIAAGAAVDLVTVAFSSRDDLPEQVLSLRSLLQHVGVPRRALVVSDGSHAAPDVALLQGIHPAVEVVAWEELAPDPLPAAVARYARAQPFGRKLALMLALPLEAPTVYADADVVFRPAAASLRTELAPPHAAARFLHDEEPYLDRRLLRHRGEACMPLNAGLVALGQAPDWEEPLHRLEGLRGVPAFHTEQTLLHLALRTLGATPLDPERYVVATDDRFCAADRHAGCEVAARHYTTPVRHKLWTTGDGSLGAGVSARHAAAVPAR
jgi:hypothetical protein